MNESIHDKFTKKILSDVESAKEFIRNVLPSEVYSQLDMTYFSSSSNSYVDDRLKEKITDVVYKTRTKGGKECFVTILIEHKSYADKYVSVQLLSYMYGIYSTELKENGRLIPVIPILYYHGKQKWEYRPLDSFFKEYSPEIREYIPGFRTEFISIQEREEIEIMEIQVKVLRIMLLLQKYLHDNQVLKRNLQFLFREIKNEEARNYIDVIIVYLLKAASMKSKDIIEIANSTDEEIKNKVMTTYDQLITKGMKKGMSKGMKKGREEGEYCNRVKTILKGYENGLDITILATINDINETEVKDILKEHGKLN